ncbi:MAG: branched-chain amino acid ABC transporter permease [Erysipelotrichaceae bacterium]|nr:branched-chain amino acid ABC transporter permease [Erysipelotrichaceae bacterium]
MYLQLLIVGIAMGMIYALLSLGIVLLVRAVGVLNFAEGQLFMLGAYVTFCLTYQVGMPLWLMIPIAVVILFLFGVLFMFSIYWPLRKSTWSATIIISCLGASSVISELVKVIWGNNPLVYAPLIKGTVKIGGVNLEYQYLIIIAVCILMIFLIQMLFDKMYVGRIMQAAAQNKYAAGLLGVSATLTVAATYGISAALVGIGGWLVAPLFLVRTGLSDFLLKGFAGMVIGGYGSVKGAVIGSILVGIIESYAVLLTTTYQNAIVFLVLIVFLVIKPDGLIKGKISEKA